MDIEVLRQLVHLSTLGGPVRERRGHDGRVCGIDLEVWLERQRRATVVDGDRRRNRRSSRGVGGCGVVEVHLEGRELVCDCLDLVPRREDGSHVCRVGRVGLEPRLDGEGCSVLADRDRDRGRCGPSFIRGILVLEVHRELGELVGGRVAGTAASPLCPDRAGVGWVEVVARQHRLDRQRHTGGIHGDQLVGGRTRGGRGVRPGDVDVVLLWALVCGEDSLRPVRHDHGDLVRCRAGGGNTHGLHERQGFPVGVDGDPDLLGTLAPVGGHVDGVWRQLVLVDDVAPRVHDRRLALGHRRREVGLAGERLTAFVDRKDRAVRHLVVQETGWGPARHDRSLLEDRHLLVIHRSGSR